jgi:hypothetical protein
MVPWSRDLQEFAMEESSPHLQSTASAQPAALAPVSGVRGASKGLVVLNVLLAVGIVLSVLTGPSQAQPAGQRPRGEYAMVSGRPPNSSTSVIYIVDASNQELASLRWDASRRTLTPIGYRNLVTDRSAPAPR